MNMLSVSIVINKKRQLLILLLIAFGLNLNTLFNEYAMDDVVVLTNNSLVQKGVKGIPQILSTDFFFGIENKNSDLSGGRYRISYVCPRIPAFRGQSFCFSFNQCFTFFTSSSTFIRISQ
jgi:hypothetical protein